MATTTPNTHAHTHTRIHRPPPAAHTIGTDRYFLEHSRTLFRTAHSHSFLLSRKFKPDAMPIPSSLPFLHQKPIIELIATSSVPSPPAIYIRPTCPVTSTLCTYDSSPMCLLTRTTRWLRNTAKLTSTNASLLRKRFPSARPTFCMAEVCVQRDLLKLPVSSMPNLDSRKTQPS